MLNLELETGRLWVELAKDFYELYRTLSEDKPSWNELPVEEQYAIECSLRSLESKVNGLNYTPEDWRQFINKRKKR
jgi:hypothetical protein